MLSINFSLMFRQIFTSLFRSKDTNYRLTAKRLKVLLICIPGYVLIMTVHWFCFLLDSVFFPRFRRRSVVKPVFIIGNFRTGSTLLFRIMARDEENFCTFKTWEIYFAPSIAERKFIRGLLLLDSLAGKPLRRLLEMTERKNLDHMLKHASKLHTIGLREAEEEEAMLLWIYNTFWLHYVFPIPSDFAPFDDFDRVMPAYRRRRIMRFYRRCVQRHLSARDGNKRLLSKNPGFTPKVMSLLEEFPDAQFLYLVRDPVETCTSTVSWFSFWFNLFNSPLEHYPLKDETIEMMKIWYTYPVEALKHLPPNRFLIINYEDFVKNPEQTIRDVYKKFGLRITDRFERILVHETHRAKSFKSSRETTAESIGLSKNIIHHRFDEIYEYFRFEKR